MAIFQISKIQVRRGQTSQTGVPHLSSGEFGWSIDTQELYIGNGSVAEGAPAVGNTRIVTERDLLNLVVNGTGTGSSSNFDLNSLYTLGTTDSAGNVLSIGQPRTLQSKLDDVVSLSDFGDITGIDDHTDLIQSAIYYSIQIGKPLVLPKYNFNISQTIFIPPLLEIQGAGPQNTIINNLSTQPTFQTIGADQISTFDIDNGISLSSSTNRPLNIKINGITLINTITNVGALFQIDCASDSIIENCSFLGNEISSIISHPYDAQAINLRDVAMFPNNTLDNLTIRNCNFYHLSAAIVSDYDAANISISENKFNNLDKGIVFGFNLTGNLSQQVGPQHVQILNNIFKNINNQAIFCGSLGLNYITDINCINNFYYNVGCNNQGDSPSTQISEIIRFESYGNFSTDETFDRLTNINTNISEYSTGTVTTFPVIVGSTLLTIKSPATLILNESDILFLYPLNTSQNITTAHSQIVIIEYTITSPNIPLIKTGTLEIVVVNQTEVYLTDTYSTNDENSSGYLSFAASINNTTNLLTITYINNIISQLLIYNTSITYTYTVRQ